MSAQEWQQRVLDEKRELDAKIEKLDNFVSNRAAFSALPGDDRFDMIDQLFWMRGYSRVLGYRIARFTVGIDPRHD